MVDLLISKEDPYIHEDKELAQQLIEIAEFIAKDEGIDYDLELSLSVVSADQIRTLNRDFRGIDEETDVLSFPLYEQESLKRLSFSHQDFPLPLGDIIISYKRALEQAEEFGHSIHRELCYLFVHSIYHLLGYDHMDEKDKRIMREKEENSLNKFGISR